MKKLLLINPDFKYFPGWLENSINYKQPALGLTYLASYIRRNCPVDIKICDASALNIKENGVLEYIKLFKPDIIGITTATPTVKFARTVALGTRRLLPEAFIVFGGPHVSALPFENLDVANVCVIGEGEETFAEIVNNFLNGLSLDKIKGIAFRRNGSYCKTEERVLVDNLDQLPFPARDLLPKYTFRHIYPYRLDNSNYDTIITSRGCSFNCNFCSNELMWKRKVRYRGLDNICEEIEKLIKESNISLLFIHDDNFTEDADRVVEFCKRKKKYFSKLKWICHARADCLSLDLLKEMKASGCLEMQIGIESGNDRILANCNKRISTSTISSTFKLLKQAKINSWATFIIGNKGENKQSIEETIEFAKAIDPTFCSFLFLIPFPGTKCFNNFSKKGYLNTYNWSKYSFHTKPVFETECLSRGLLMSLRKKAYRKYYLRPKILFRYFCACIISRQWKLTFSNSILLLKFILGLIKK
ncbi:radical SAM protein [Patescibacteria group bacterium]|nr:radical SAM protein [Patescibacteria group bacterium]